MQKPKKSILLLLILIAILAFFLFSIPNSEASENLAMVSMFEPDEGAIVPILLNMIAPKETIKQFVYQFIFYRYYYYGFPYFASSAVVLFPLQWLNQADNVPLVMLVLRQMISVLPMLIALLILVYMQDGFRTYRSVVLFVFLLSIPAVVRNGFWLHPDGLVLLLSVLVIYFLWKDNRAFGKGFLIAGALCGVLIATKLVGAFFFLAVGMSLIWGLVEKKLTWKKAIWASLLFILVMTGAFVISNPFLLSKWGRIEYFNVAKKQADLLSEGYGVLYAKGISAAWPLIHEYYGEAIFLLTTLGVTIWSAVKSKDRFLPALTLAWFIPLTSYLLFFVHFKYQYWLPVAVPLISNLVLLLPESWKDLHWKRWQWVGRMLVWLIVAVQFARFFTQSIQMATAQTDRKENNSQIDCYNQTLEQLESVFPNEMHVYYDYRLYLPETTGWMTETSYDLLDYQYIQERDFQILLLLEQRIRDYLNPGVTGIDPDHFALNQQFYRDADNGTIEGYYLIYRNETGLIYVRDDVCQEYFNSAQCR